MGTVSELATAVEDDQVVFRLSDPGHAFAAVRLWSDVALTPDAGDLELARSEGGWELRLPLPDLDCLEYLFEVDGTLAPDPGNPDRVDGAFGPHSWLPMPGYEPPAWLAREPAAGHRTRLAAGEIDVEVWEPAGHEDAPLPLLLVHDGAEMDAYGRVVHYAATLPPMRVALLSPGPNRDERYSANPEYAAALCGEVIPALTTAFETPHKPVLLGQSLGALAALHAAYSAPGYGETFAGMMLQSGSFFTRGLDSQEAGFPHFDRVVEFVNHVRNLHRAVSWVPPLAMTCGTAEENLANNLAMRDHLRVVGRDVGWGEVRQGHTWMCWRDTLDPHLGDLLGKVWH